MRDEDYDVDYCNAEATDNSLLYVGRLAKSGLSEVKNMGLFGSGKKQDVRLTKKQMKELTKNMSGSELREFKKKKKDIFPHH